MKYFVSRQSVAITGEQIIEIAAHGMEHCGCDILAKKWPELGEGKEFSDPRKALEAALAIREKWQAELNFEGRFNALQTHGDGTVWMKDPEKCRIEAGYNADLILISEYPTDAELREWAEKEWQRLMKEESAADTWESLGRGYVAYEPNQAHGTDM